MKFIWICVNANISNTNISLIFIFIWFVRSFIHCGNAYLHSRPDTFRSSIKDYCFSLLLYTNQPQKVNEIARFFDDLFLKCIDFWIINFLKKIKIVQTLLWIDFDNYLCTLFCEEYRLKLQKFASQMYFCFKMFIFYWTIQTDVGIWCIEHNFNSWISARKHKLNDRLNLYRKMDHFHFQKLNSTVNTVEV